MGSLLAVDLGLKSGLALFNRDGTLAWYRSHNFGSRERLKRGIPGILETIPDISAIVMEGGVIWLRCGRRKPSAVVYTSKHNSYPLPCFNPTDEMFSRIPTANRVTSKELPP